MDCVVDDELYNRVGTYPIAATANDQGVPVSVVGSAAKLIEGGFAFENEFRSTAEVMREPADNFTIDNPAYDATPMRLVDSVITDESLVEYSDYRTATTWSHSGQRNSRWVSTAVTSPRPVDRALVTADGAEQDVPCVVDRQLVASSLFRFRVNVGARHYRWVADAP